jgi:lysyl-tRNA synthetase class 2
MNSFGTQAPVDNLKIRASLLGRLRRFFDARNFIEVQTPVLCRETVVDRHLDPIAVSIQMPGESVRDWYLQTSPEQSMKRLLASGIGSIYQVGPVFRGGEFGKWHNPEFIMAEWYDVGADYEQGKRLLSNLVAHLLDTDEADRISFENAFRNAVGLPLFESGVGELAKWSISHGLVHSESWSSDWDDWVNLIFSETVQDTLGRERPVIVDQFPASQAALAVVNANDPRTAERFEIFYQGVELANGYHELLDADILEVREAEANRLRSVDGKSDLPGCPRLREAMRFGIPGSCGCALGFDRVVMLACGAKSLSEVISFSAERA